MPDVSSLQLLVPGAEVLLDAVRGLPDLGLLEPAHISLGYPWMPAADARRRVGEVRAAARSVAAFEVRFDVVARFAPDTRGRVLVHVAPADPAPVRALADALDADLRDVHLSVARVLPEGDADGVVAVVQDLLPLTTPVEELQLTA